jgi:hypothetical protein
MKTTIEIADPLLNQARRLAAREGITLKTLVELGLRHVIAEKKAAGDFKLRRASFKGTGLQPAARQAGWEGLRARAYEGYGD